MNIRSVIESLSPDELERQSVFFVRLLAEPAAEESRRFRFGIARLLGVRLAALEGRDEAADNPQPPDNFRTLRVENRFWREMAAKRRGKKDLDAENLYLAIAASLEAPLRAIAN